MYQAILAIHPIKLKFHQLNWNQVNKDGAK